MNITLKLKAIKSSLDAAAHVVESIQNIPVTDIEFQEVVAAASQAEEAAKTLYMLAGYLTLVESQPK